MVQIQGLMMWCKQASKNQREGEELIRKAQQYMRETKAQAKKNEAVAEDAQQQLAGAKEALQTRSDLCHGIAFLWLPRISGLPFVQASKLARERSLSCAVNEASTGGLCAFVSRDQELAASLARAERAEERAHTAQLEATQAQAALNEVQYYIPICPLLADGNPCTPKQALHAPPHTTAFLSTTLPLHLSFSVADQGASFIARLYRTAHVSG